MLFRSGKDYIFKNNDPTDFRRENLIILNHYHGVQILEKNGNYSYVARIHIKGYYKIGNYNSLIDAAIAYNKAIDILQKNGLSKNFNPNYITEISASTYAEIYSNIKISSKIINYFSK